MSMKRSAIFVMYNALFTIGAIDDHLHSRDWCFLRAQEIANLALKEMHVEHTKVVQKALGLKQSRR